MSFTIPKEIKWQVEDFKDLYKTMNAFKKRFMKRRKSMTMKIKIKNEDLARVAVIKTFDNNATEPSQLQSEVQILPGEEKDIYIHSTRYVVVEETENIAKSKED